MSMTPPRPPSTPRHHPVPHAPWPAPAPAARTNTLAVIALVTAFVAPIIGLVLGVVARRQLGRTGENGRGAATTAVVLGAVFSLAWVVALVAVISVGSFSTSFSTAPAVPPSSVATQIEARAGLPGGSVTCSDPLPAQLGATTTCTAVLDGTPTPVVATVTSVDGSDVGFDFTSR